MSGIAVHRIADLVVDYVLNNIEHDILLVKGVLIEMRRLSEETELWRPASKRAQPDQGGAVWRDRYADVCGDVAPFIAAGAPDCMPLSDRSGRGMHRTRAVLRCR